MKLNIQEHINKIDKETEKQSTIPQKEENLTKKEEENLDTNNHQEKKKCEEEFLKNFSEKQLQVIRDLIKDILDEELVNLENEESLEDYDSEDDMEEEPDSDEEENYVPINPKWRNYRKK